MSRDVAKRQALKAFLLRRSDICKKAMVDRSNGYQPLFF
jgi:hypothetical protein